MCLVKGLTVLHTEFAGVSPQVAHVPQQAPATGAHNAGSQLPTAAHREPCGSHQEHTARSKQLAELVLTLVITRKSFRSSVHKGGPQNKLTKKETTLKVSGKRKLTVKFSSLQNRSRFL